MPEICVMMRKREREKREKREKSEKTEKTEVKVGSSSFRQGTGEHDGRSGFAHRASSKVPHRLLGQGDVVVVHGPAVEDVARAVVVDHASAHHDAVAAEAQDGLLRGARAEAGLLGRPHIPLPHRR
eukprot:scaffold1021_cov241-Pinguiococcus_pyrenoidosus.AAC.18